MFFQGLSFDSTIITTNYHASSAYWQPWKKSKRALSNEFTFRDNFLFIKRHLKFDLNVLP